MLLLDLLTLEEEKVDLFTRQHRFDIPLLAGRMECTTRWAAAQPELAGLATSGASTGSAAALIAAAHLPSMVAAAVCRGGRPECLRHLRCQKELESVAGATHLFEEPGTLERVARLAADWFTIHLVRATQVA